MAELAPGQSSAVGLGFGHTATMARTESDTFVVNPHGPPGTAAIEIDVTKSGAVVQARFMAPAPSGATAERRASALPSPVCELSRRVHRDPQQVAQVRERYGRPDAEEAVETEAWRQKFAAEPNLFEL